MPPSERISQYRARLDQTLASSNLMNAASVKALIKDQLLRSSLNEIEEFSDNLLERRTMEVSNFLNMLRSASFKTHGELHGEWKLKQDNEEFRVMYREGLHGSPFHTLLVEGYVNGPVHACLCVSMESALYKNWWPQYNVPTFKITTSECLHKIRIGEQISLVRMKVSWPLSAREAVVHYFVFEYLEDDLIIVLLNTISDTEDISRNTHGYAKELIPDAKGVIRIEAVGGFALQKVTAERSYFRTIANMDIKLDFVPPSLINFISRQLVGSGFRLYQKAVASVFNTDEDFNKALVGPLYARISEALYDRDKQEESLERKEPRSEARNLLKENFVEIEQEDIKDESDTIVIDHIDGKVQSSETLHQDSVAICEIEKEIEEEGGQTSTVHLPNNDVGENLGSITEREICIRPQVEQALETLEKVINIVREYRGSDHRKSSFSSFVMDEESQDHESSQIEVSTSVGHESCSKVTCVEVPSDETTGTLDEATHNSGDHVGRNRRSSSSSREVNHNKVVPASPQLVKTTLVPRKIDRVASCSSQNGTIGAPGLEELATPASDINIKNTDAGKKPSRRRKYLLCCIHPTMRN